MIVYKCKMCNGNLYVEEGSTSAICRYCGTQQEVYSSNNGIVQSLERLLQNGDTYMRLEKYESAFEVYMEMTRCYPEEYRGWWGVIQSSTYNFHRLKAEEKIVEWLACVKKLASEEVYREKLQEYIEFLRRLSRIYVLSEFQKVEELIEDYQKQVNGLNAQIEVICREEEKCKQKFLNEDNLLKHQIDCVEDAIRNLRGKGEEIRKRKITGWVLILVGVVWWLVISETPAWFFGGLLFLTCIIYGIASIVSGKNETPGIYKNIADNESKMESFENERERVKEAYEQEMRVISAKKEPVNDDIYKYRQKISDCTKYINSDSQEVGKVLFSLECDKLGVVVGCSQELKKLRSDVFQVSYKASEDSKLNVRKIVCYRCRTEAEISVQDIRCNNNAFKCRGCGQIIHVNFK